MRHLFGPLRHLNPVVFDSEGGGGGGSKDNKSSNKPKATGNLAAGAPTKQLGSVSKDGQYAGDGFSWVSHGTNENGSEMLTRTYTGANKDAGLGQAVSVAGNDGNNNNKAKIAEISMKEGSPYAASKSSATDGDFLEFIKSGFKSFGASDSYAAQVGNTNYTPNPNYGFTGGSDDSGSFNDAFAAAREAAGGSGKTFDYRGKSYTTDLAPETSVRPQLRPEPAVDFNAKLEAAGMADVSPLDLLAAPAPENMIQPDAGAVQDYFTTGAGSPGFVAPVDYTKTASGSPFAAAAQLDFADRYNERVTDNAGGIGSLPGYENTAMNFQNRVSTPGELEAQLAALDDGGVQVAQNATSYADYTAEDFLRDANLPNTGPPSMGFPTALQTKIMENDRLRAEAEAEYANSEGTGIGGLTTAGIMQAGELVSRGLEKGIDYFDPAQQYMFGDAGIGVPQLDSSGNVIPEIDMGFAKALGADPNRRGMIAGSDNQVANYIGGVADNIQASKEQRLEDIKDTTFGQAKNRDIFGTGSFGPDPMALFSEIVYGVPTTAAIVGTSLANPLAGAGLGATMTTGELVTEIENRMDSRIANGEFGPISNDQAAQLKNDYVQQITPYAAGMGIVEGLTFGLMNKIPGKTKYAAPFLEGFASEGFLEPTLAESVIQSDGQNIDGIYPVFDEEGAAVGTALGGVGAVMASPPGFNSNAVKSVTEDGPNNSGVASDGTVPGPMVDPSGNVLYGSILNPELSPTAGEIADSSVTTSYDNVFDAIDGKSYDLSGFAQGPIVTPRADNNAQVTDQTNLLDTQAKSDGAALLSEMILDDASLEQSATTGNVVELASKLELPMNDAIEVATEVSERAAREKADMLGLIAGDEVSKSGSINEDTLAEINSMLSEEMAADVIEQANAGESLNGQTALDLFLENDINTATAKRQQAEAAARETANAQLLSSMSGIELAPMAPEVNNAPPSVLSEVSDQQAQENYAAIQAQEQAYTQTLTETGDAIAAEAAGNAAYDNAVAPKLNTPEMDGSVTVDNVVPINDTVLSDSAQYLRSIIGDQANLSIDGKSQLGEGTVVENDLQTTFTEVEVPSETSAEIFDKFLQTGSDNIDIFRQVLNPDAEYAATVVKDAIAIADGTESNYESATAEELADVREDIYDKTQEFLSDQPNEMVVYRIGETPSGEVKSFTTNPNFKATLNLPWVEGEGNLQAYTVKKSDILGSPDITSRGPIGENEIIINVDSVTPTGTLTAKTKEQRTVAVPPQFGSTTDVALDTNLNNSFTMARDKVYNKGRDFKLDLQAKSLEAQEREGIDLSTLDDANIDRLADFAFTDALEALKDNQNAIGWYGRTVDQALKTVAELHPEVLTDPKAKMQFIWATAVTSNGLKVDKNFELALDVYETLKETGRFPTDAGIGQAAKGINFGLGQYHTMLDKFNRLSNSDDGAHALLADFMDSKFPLKQLEKEYDVKISGEGKDTLIRGAAILGPKIGGGFYSNLYGKFDELTMDRWLMRTVGRWRGGLVKINKPMIKKKTTEIKGMMKSYDLKPYKPLFVKSDIRPTKNMSKSKVELLSAEIAKLSMDPEWRKQINAIPGGPELRKAGNALAKYLDGQVEAPAGPKERNFIRAVFAQTLDRLNASPELKAISNEAITMSDLQALMWYPEKRLYDTAKQKDGESRGYKDDEAPDYANAARKAIRNRLGSSGRTGSPRGGTAPTDAGLPGATRQGILGQFFGGGQRNAAPKNNDRSQPVSEAEIRAQIPVVQAVFEIDKKGSEYENGIRDFDAILNVAKAYSIIPKLYRSFKDMEKADPTITEGALGAYNPNNRQAMAIMPGGIDAFGGTVSGLASLSYMVHEVAHGIAGSDINTNQFMGDKFVFNYLTNQDDTAGINSLEAVFGDLVNTPNDARSQNKIIAEMLAVQKNLTFKDPDTGQVLPLRQTKSLMDSYNAGQRRAKAIGVKSEQFNKDVKAFEKQIIDQRNYEQSIPELTVNALQVAMMHPKIMKKVAPNTYKLLKHLFDNSKNKSGIKFFNHSLAMAVAVLLAMMARGEEPPEEQSLPPGALSPAPGILAA